MESLETHMACVFLTDRFAYKLKKPIRQPFLDYRTLEARRRTCEAEVRLNRRLAPDVYLGTVALTLEPSGELALAGRGDVVDWLVKMRRLPRECMLDRLIERNAVEADQVRRLGGRLGRFYLVATPVSVAPPEYREGLRRRIRECRSVLAAPDYGLSAARVERIAGELLAFVEASADLLDRRVEEGRIVDGHGDLRAEHVCFDPEPVIIDCIEFRRDFRILDPLDDLASLAVDCERLGADWIGDGVFAASAEVTGDRPTRELRDFYRGLRAVLRGKLAAWHTRDAEAGDRPHWLELADRYLRLAERRRPAAP